ncbi:MAG: tetratricopeptide repeat protein [Sandaracinaceae bacterium]|nr:tetratricopeptide repeat protein [Sandaracinaceae bacterium]
MSEAEPIDEELEELFSLDGPGPARRQTSAASAALIGAALDGWEAAPPLDPTATTSPTAGAGASVPWAKVAMLAAAIGAGVGAAVAAAVLWGSTETRPPAPEAPPTEAVAPSTPEPERLEAPTPEAPVVEVPAPDVEASPAPEAPRPPRAERRPTPRPAERPEDLIARGNELRAERRWAEAEQAYLSASRAQPRSSTSHIADVAAAGIRLDHRGDPAGAVTLFERALAARPSGPLALEAREGIARAERRRGRAAAERAALEAIVAHHAGTAAAARARTRLQELSP